MNKNINFLVLAFCENEEEGRGVIRGVGNGRFYILGKISVENI